ncbi:anoctamin-8 isoform X1 [Phyllopteryx taeniolatus]|uniref:anoctamin-8 isoform X1 n=1 Tax=Phyllopteryx taeniolatus TaxID=161469 RepID=UPI002AD431A5|nr:anoctamin-8 isoform X1 [Phyllopteryx taeniolatus]XP_061634630.1 anoctamin-8 isoform X1 [Phyllopteryx taeniolatus]
MPDAGTQGAAAPVAAAAGGGATAAGDGSESSRHRHRTQQAEAERPETVATPPLSSGSGVLDKLFGKRLLQAGRHVMSHKSWMKTVPTENCDVLMTFADTTDDHTLLWLLNHIRLGIPELIIQIRHHKHTRVYAFFVTATYENLLRGAEEIGLRKAVKPEFGAGTRNFSCEEDYIYENIESELCFFTSQERQSIIKYWLDNLRAKHGEVLHNINFLEGQPIIPELSARGVIQQMFPLHEQRVLSHLMKSWVQAVCEKQPLDDICDYFGVKIAMYFAWLGFYTTSMLYPAVIGFVLWMLTESDQTSRDICCVVFALFNVVWATLFLERWKRRGAELAYKWGTLDTPAESLEEPRPQFRGVKRCSPVTGCEEFYYPPWRRRVFRWLVSLPICLLCLCFVFLAMLICFELQEFVMGIKEMPRLARFIPKIMLAITVTACDEVYRKIACWLNDMENYRLQSAYEKNLIIKIVLFQFVNSYLSLFYIGFYLKDMERLKEMLATLLIIRQFLQNVKEVLQPYVYERHKLGELTLRALWDLLLSVLLKYARLAAGKAQASPTDPAMPGPGLRGTRPGVGHTDKREKKCLNGGCGVPDEEESGKRDEADSGRFSEGETDEESLIDCGLKLRKVSFIEKMDRRPACSDHPVDDSFMEEGSPTMVEKGMDPNSVFSMCDDEDVNGIHDVKETGGSVACAAEGVSYASAAACAAPPASRSESSASLRNRRRGRSTERAEPRTKRESWIDPPEVKESTTLTQAEIESCMQTYEDTFQDYQEMFVQFGYVVLFSSAFPLAAMCALINNIIEIRSDAFKLCTGLQRPFGLRVESIGQWQSAMEAMGLIAIIVNCYLIGQCGQLQRLFPWLSPEMAIISIVILEHFAILLKYVIHVAIPDIPTWVREEMAKLDYQRREAFKKHERQAQQHYQQLQRKKREEEERQRQVEHMARRERDRDDGKGDTSAEHHHDKSHSSKSRSGGGGGGGAGGSDKPKRPSSLLANNNVMKLKQIIPLQSKFSSGGARSPQSPTEAKLPGFLSFKFLKSPENKKESAATSAAAASSAANGTTTSSSSSSSSGSSSQERSQSPSKAFNPGKLFNFGKSEAGTCVNGAALPRPGEGSSSSQMSERPASRSDLNGIPDEIPSPGGEGFENGHSSELDPPGPKV